MIRRIIEIDEDKCNGCGLCADACHEDAIGIVDGKAKLLRDDYCDGLGDCLPNCPTGAISFVEREAAAYDREAVEANMKKKAEMTAKDKIEEKPVFHGCPGTRMKIMDHKAEEVATEQTATVSSHLSQWPVQIKLVPVNAPYFKDANLLIAADCTAYAYGNFHQKFIKNKVTLIGCPKLDEGDYSEKLTQIIANNDIKSVTIVRMEVPCCGGLENAAKKAIQDSGKFLPWQVHTISIDGKILEAKIHHKYSLRIKKIAMKESSERRRDSLFSCIPAFCMIH